MRRIAPLISLRRCLAAMALATGGLVSFSGHAALTLTNPVSVAAIAPGGFTGNAADAFTLSDSVDPATGIAAGDASNIGGGFMLAGEFISFVNDSIHVHVAAGATNGAGQSITGVFGAGGSHARYEFDNLAFSGKVITGIAVYGFDGFGTSGNKGLIAAQDAASFVSFDGTDMVTLILDDLILADRLGGTSLDFAEFRIDLITRDDGGPPPNDTPEPASVALVAAALLGLRLSRRAARGA